MDGAREATNGLHDFEFLYGEWLVQGRRRQKPLSGCDRWEAFDAIQKCWPLLNGAANVDELISEEHGALSASVRFLDAGTRRWTTYRVSPSDGLAQASMQGGFRHGVGEFFGEEVWNGRLILVRERWLQSASGAPVWDKSFSDDGGSTWEINCTMQLARVHWPLEHSLDTIPLARTNDDMAVSF